MKMETSDRVDDDFLNYVSAPSLQNMCMIKIVIRLWKLPDCVGLLKQITRESYDELRTSGSSEDFHAAERHVSKKVCLLPLPDRVKQDTSNLIRPIGLQILSWLNNHDDFPDIPHEYRQRIDYICWTVQGTIDVLQTLYLNLNDNSVGVCIRHLFRIACDYCLEDYVVNLWNKMADDLKDHLSNENVGECYDGHLIAYWTYYCKKELSKLVSLIEQDDPDHIYDSGRSIAENMFSLSVWEGNIVATKYFWQHLTKEEISRNKVTWAEHVLKCSEYAEKIYQRHDQHTDFLFSLMSQMSKEQQKLVYVKYSEELLELLFFCWPWQKYLLPTINVMFPFLDKNVFVELMFKIVHEIKEGRAVEKLFAEVWIASPVEMKQHFLKEIINDSWRGRQVFWNLLKVKDVDTLKLLLEDESDKEKEQIIFAVVQDKELPIVIEAGGLDVLKMLDELIASALTTDSDRKKCKDLLVLKNANSLCHQWICKDNWDMANIFLKWCLSSEEEIKAFKRDFLNKMDISCSLIGTGNWDSLDKLMKWSFDTDQEIAAFKKDFPNNAGHQMLLNLCCSNWESFERFIHWCFKSEDEVRSFRKRIAQEMNCFCPPHTEFSHKLKSWCFRNKFL